MASSGFPSLVTGVTVQTATSGALSGDGSSGNKLAVAVDGSTIHVNGDDELEVISGGGGIGGSVAIHQVPYASGANTLAGTNDIAWMLGSISGPNERFSINGQATETDVHALTVRASLTGAPGDISSAVRGFMTPDLDGGSEPFQFLTTFLVEHTRIANGFAEKVAGVYQYAPENIGGGSIGTFFHQWREDLSDAPAVNAYYDWDDSQGVRRRREDDTFDSVGQSIEALYNPLYAKYIPGTQFFERGVLGQWNGDIFEIGTEAGPEIAVTSVTSVGMTATLVAPGARSVSYAEVTGALSVTISGANQNEYNGTYELTPTEDADTFIYTFAGSATSPATGTIKAQGGALRPTTIIGANVTIRLQNSTSMVLNGEFGFFDFIGEGGHSGGGQGNLSASTYDDDNTDSASLDLVVHEGGDDESGFGISVDGDSGNNTPNVTYSHPGGQAIFNGATSFQFASPVQAQSYKSDDGTVGATAGPFTTITAIRVKNGLVTTLTGA